MADRLGQQLGNYRLTALLGQGGFAKVYLGEHIYLNTTAAIKVLHAQLSSNEAEDFLVEARTIARLIHPNIVRVLEFDVEDATPFLIVDYAPNGTLRKSHPKGVRLPLATIVSYVKQLADALQYAHDQRIIHRDIKPENMLLGRRKEILLSDFGIAVVTQSTRYQSTQSLQEVAGTIAYMSPEQIQSQAGPLSDQYSLAVAVYEWLAGERPFHGSFAEVAVKHTLVPPPSLKRFGVPESIESVVMKALAKDPAQRYPRIAEFALALERVFLQDPGAQTLVFDQFTPQASAHPLTPVLPAIATQSDTSGETLVFPDGFERGEAQGISSLAALLANSPSSLLPTTTGLPEHQLPISGELVEDAFKGYAASPIPAQAPVDVGEKAEVSGAQAISIEQVEQPGTEASEVPSTSAQPDRAGSIWSHPQSRRKALYGLGGTALALGLGAGALAISAHLLPPMPNIIPTPSGTIATPLFAYREHSSLVWSVAWSPNGRYLASAGSDNTVQIWDASDGMHAFTYSGHTDTVYAVAWAPGSPRIASASYDGTVQTWDATTGFYPHVYRGHSSWVWTVAWSPNGRLLASAGADSTVRIWDAASAQTMYIYRGHSQAVHSVAWSPDGRYIASTSSDGTVQVWEANTGMRQNDFSPIGTIPWSAAWSPDSLRIAAACENKSVQLFDASSSAHLYAYHGHSDFVYAVAWSPNGKHVASGGDDKVVQVWDPTNGSTSSSFTGHSATIRSISWSPDGQRIASASWDKTVQVWKAL